MLYQKKIVSFLAVLFLVLLSGCSHRGEPQPVNELRFSLNGISDVTISYDEERITFFEAESDELVLREYMTENKAAYHAKVDQRGEYLHISEGGKPVFKESFNRYIEVYLPASYQGNLTVTTTDGNIDLSEVPLELSTLCVDSTSGRVEISQVSADSIKLSSTSGTIDIGQLNAKRIQLETTSGSISCDSVEGYVVYSSRLTWNFDLPPLPRMARFLLPFQKVFPSMGRSQADQLVCIRLSPLKWRHGTEIYK